LACELPAESEVPLARWSSGELAREAVARGICEQISGVRYGAGCPRTRSSPGSTAPGSFPAIPSSPPRPAASSSFTAAAGKASCCIPATTSSAAMRSPRSKPGIANTRPARRRRRQARAERRARVRARWRALLPRRLGRPAREAVRPLRSRRRDRPVRRARRAVHVGRALQQRPARVRDRRQRLSPSARHRSGGCRARGRTSSSSIPRSTPAGSTSRDLLLDRPAQATHPQRLPRPRHAPAAPARVQPPLRQIATPFEWKFTRADLDQLAHRLDQRAA